MDARGFPQAKRMMDTVPDGCTHMEPSQGYPLRIRPSRGLENRTKLYRLVRELNPKGKINVQRLRSVLGARGHE